MVSMQKSASTIFLSSSPVLLCQYTFQPEYIRCMQDTIITVASEDCEDSYPNKALDACKHTE